MIQQERFLVFRIGDQRHALNVGVVERALRAAAVTPLPGAPGSVVGALDVAGDVLPVLSIARRFGLSQPAIRPEGHFILARMGRRRVVLPVDEVIEVVERPAVTPPNALVPGLERLEGIGKLDNGLVAIHDLEKFFAPDEWRTLDAALDARRP